MRRGQVNSGEPKLETRPVGRSHRREIGASVLLCLAGSVLVLSGAGRTWAVVELAGRAPLPDATVRLSGAELAAGVRALGLVGLAAVLALPATRRLGRVAVGVLLLLAGSGVVALVVRVLADPAVALTGAGVAAGRPDGGVSRSQDAAVPGVVTMTSLPVVCLIGGVLLAVAGLLVVVRGRRWSSLSSRYEPPVGAAPDPLDAPAGERPPDRAVWDALDRGEDPTHARD